MFFIKQYWNRHEVISSLCLIVLVALLAYVPLLTSLGYYYDDFLTLWTGYEQGANGLFQSFYIDRPGVGVLFGLAYGIFANTVVYWQLLALVIRISGAVTLFWGLRSLWPEKREFT